MPAITRFVLIPKSAINDLRAAAVPTKTSWLGRSVDAFPDFLRRRGREVATYRWSSWVMSTLLEYLNEKQSIDLTASSYDDLSDHLSKARGSAHFILTSEHRRDYLDKLDAGAFTEDELRDYYNEFSSVTEKDAGRPMSDGITTLHEALAHVDDKTIVILEIG